MIGPDVNDREILARFDPIARYFLRRVTERGDIYGWAPIAGPQPLQALLLVALDAPEESFPAEIGGIGVVLKHVSAPEASVGRP